MSTELHESGPFGKSKQWYEVLPTLCRTRNDIVLLAQSNGVADTATQAVEVHLYSDFFAAQSSHRGCTGGG